MYMEETNIEKRKKILEELRPEAIYHIARLATKAADGTVENFIETCLAANTIFCESALEVFYYYLWQYVSMFY